MGVSTGGFSPSRITSFGLAVDEGAVGLKLRSGAEIRLRQLRETADGRMRHAPSAAQHDAMLREESARLPGKTEARLEIRDTAAA